MDMNSPTNAASQLGAEIREIRKARGLTLNALSAELSCSENRRQLSEMYTRSEAELGFRDELLSSTLSGQCYLILSRFAPGTGEPPEPLEGYVFEGEQHAIVLSGEVELRLGDELIVLRKGDSFSYPSMIAHRFRNRTDQEATMVWAMSPVRISW